MNLDQVIERSEAYDEKKLDFVVAAKDITFNQLTCNMEIPTAFGPKMSLKMTDWAFGQTCQKLGNLPKRYLDKCDPVLKSFNLFWWSKDSQDKWMVRSYDGKARAVLSDRYVIISNTNILHKVSNLLMGTDIELIEPHISPDTLHLKIAVTGNEHYRVGVYVGNGETGNNKVRVRPFIQRTSCTNSITFSRGGFEHMHIHSTDAWLYGSIKEHIGQGLKLADKYVDRFVKAEMDQIPEISDVVKSICKKRGYSQATQDNVLIGTEGMRSRMGLVNGFSYAAHAGGLGIEQQTDMEMLAGDLLFARRL